MLEITKVQMESEKSIFYYGIVDKKTGKLINRKSNSSNALYRRVDYAEQKVLDDKEEVVKFQLIRVNA